MKQYFDRIYSGRDASYAYDKEVLALIVRNAKGKKVLDLGCGEGGLAIALAEQGFDVTCVDISKTAIKRLAGKKVAAVCADLDTYTIAGKYDVIICTGVLHFTKNGADILAAIRSHTAKGGINVIDVFLKGSTHDAGGHYFTLQEVLDGYTQWRIIEKEEYTHRKDKNLFLVAEA